MSSGVKGACGTALSLVAIVAAGCANDPVDPAGSSQQPGGSPPIKCPASGILAEGEHDPYFIVATPTHVYWSSMEGVRAAPVSGGPATTVASGQTFRTIAAHGDDLFLADYAALNIRRIRDGQETVVANANGSEMVVAGEFLYWTQQSEDNMVALDTKEGTIARVPLSGGPVEVLIDELETPLHLAVNEHAVFWGPSSWPYSIHRWSFATGLPEEVTAGVGPNIAASEAGAFFATDSWPSKLMFVPNAGPAQEMLPLPAKGVVAADASGVYVGTDTGRVVFLPEGGTELKTLATDLGSSQGVGRMALVDGALFVTVPSSGQIICLDRSSSPVPPVDDTCPDPLGTPAEVAATPRADEDMELLALRLDGGITATQATYERLVRDKAAIQVALPGVDVQYFPPNEGKSVELRATEPTALAMRDGAYTAWDCLNAFYSVQELHVGYLSIVDGWYVDVELKGRYDMVRLAELYGKLPGVIEAFPTAQMGDGPTTCVSRSEDTYEYVVDDRGGDCPAGCTETTAYYFVSASVGQVEHIDTWDGFTATPPTWYSICEGY